MSVAIGYLVAVVLWIVLNKEHARAFLRTLVGFVVIAFWFSAIEPRMGGQFPAELTLPYAEFKGETVVIHNVRNCTYRSKDDFDAHYEVRAYDLKDLRTLDVLVNYWGMDAIAHTFLSFGFSDGRYIAVSVEIRPQVGQVYDMLQGFFKQYQLIYIWADERDLVRLRTNFKEENVYLYRTTFTPENVRKMFISMLEGASSIHRKPEFYNTLTHSCTNTLGNHLISARIMDVPIWKRKFLTGDIDKRLYNEGVLSTRVPFSDLRREANIDARANRADQDPEFSKRIRTHLFKE